MSNTTITTNITEVNALLLATEKETVNTLLIQLNTTYADNDTPEVQRIKLEITTALTKLNAAEKASAFTAITGKENITLEAAKVGYITLTTLKLPTEKENTYSLNSKIEIIDLVELSRYSTENIFKNSQAPVFMEALNHAVLNFMYERQNITKKSSRLDKFKISHAATMLGITKDDLNTISGFIPALQKVVDAIVDGVTVTNVEAETLLFNYSKWGKGINGVSMAIEDNFRRMIMRILYKVVNNGEFIAE